MNYSPTLKIAMEQIKDILKKHDIGGVVILHKPGFIEFLNKIDPMYSCATWMRNEMMEPIGARFRANVEIYGSAEARNRAIAETENLLMNVVEIMGRQWMMWDEIYKQFEKAVGPFEHTENVITSHESQNN